MRQDFDASDGMATVVYQGISEFDAVGYGHFVGFDFEEWFLLGTDGRDCEKDGDA